MTKTGEPMSADEALNAIQDRLGSHYQEPGVVRAELERLQKVVADQTLTIGCLNDAHAEELKRARVEAGVFSKDARDWKGRAETARLALDVALKEVERLHTLCEKSGSTLSRLRPALLLDREAWDEMEVMHNRLCRSRRVDTEPGVAGDLLTAEPGQWEIDGHTVRRVVQKPGDDK